LVLNPNDAVGWGAKGIIAEAKGDKAVAIFAYNKAIKLNPNDTETLKNLHKLEHPT
jgi:Flp pilus assembly protein TadD